MRFFRLLVTSRRTLGRAFALVRDPRVPIRLKLLTLAAALLIVSPLNLLGDIPLLGFFDDAALLGLLAAWFVRSAGRHAAGEPDRPYGEAAPNRTSWLASR